MKPSRRQFFYIMGAFLAACSPVGTEPDYTIIIHQDNSFEPASLIIPRGSIVAWQNRADSVHTITADPTQAQRPERILLPSEAQAFDSGNLYPGDRWSYTFETAGDYIYFCRYHELEEMLALIRVVA